MEQETVNGYDIPLRKLNEEESTREISVERFREFHYAAGEDFLDGQSEGPVQGFIFGGWLIHKYPAMSKEILDHINENIEYLDMHCFKDIDFLGEYIKDEDIDQIYFEVAEFANQTEALKKRINQTLIQVCEYYND